MSESGLNLLLFGAAILLLQQQLFSNPKLYRLIKKTGAAHNQRWLESWEERAAILDWSIDLWLLQCRCHSYHTYTHLHTMLHKENRNRGKKKSTKRKTRMPLLNNGKPESIVLIKSAISIFNKNWVKICLKLSRGKRLTSSLLLFKP